MLSLVAGDSFSCLYPLSNNGEFVLRSGTIERVGTGFVVVKIGENNFRTFKFDKLTARKDSVSVFLTNGTQHDGVVSHINEDAIYLSGEFTHNLGQASRIELASIVNIVKQS